MENTKHNIATSRLKKELLLLKGDPVPQVAVEPLPSNILEWHFALTGQENTPYQGGVYHGKLVFPEEYPYKPPSFYMITPNGRFGTDIKLCLTMGDFRPDMWNPAWRVSTILTALRSFMTEEEEELSAVFGSVEACEDVRRRLALESLSFNLRDQQFCELFPEHAHEMRTELGRRSQVQQTSGAVASTEINRTRLVRTGQRHNRLQNIFTNTYKRFF